MLTRADVGVLALAPERDGVAVVDEQYGPAADLEGMSTG
jgi:hypothetical protein